MPNFKSQVGYILSALILLSCFGIGAADAVGLGKIKIYSYLHEPLVAEIEVSNIQGLDTKQLLVKLASAQDFARAGIDRPYFLNNIAFEIIVYNGKAYVYMRSVKPVQVPYLEFLVELSWPEGSLIKDYTVLVDPPPPNLTKETRPKSFGQLAQIEAQQRSFGADPVQEQLSAQELIIDGSSMITPEKTTKKSFSQEDLSVATEEGYEAAPLEGSTELVPEVVPDVTEEEIQLEIPKPPPGPTEFEKQLEAFEQRQLDSAAVPKSKSTLGRLTQGLTGGGKTESLQKDITTDDKASTLPTPKTSPVSSTVAITSEPKALQPQEQVEVLPDTIDDEIDFQEVIPKVSQNEASAELAESTVSSSTRAQERRSQNVVPPADEGSGIVIPLILGLVFIVLLVVGGLAAKKFILRKKSKQTDQEVYAWNDQADEQYDELSTDYADKSDNDENGGVSSVDAVEKAADAETSMLTEQDLEEKEEHAEEIEIESLPVESENIETEHMSEDTLLEVEKELTDLDLDALQPTPTNESSSGNLSESDSLLQDESSQNSSAHIDADTQDLANSIPDLFPKPEGGQDFQIDSGLKLAPDENEPPIVDKDPTVQTLGGDTPVSRSPEIDMKIDLARKYLEAGDNESAKATLIEAKTYAKDAQLVEIEMLLSNLH